MQASASYPKCESCAALSINGVYCHETGCPDAWMTETRECPWCGSEFRPKARNQAFCDDSCGCAYHGLPEDDSFDQEWADSIES